MKKTLNYLEEKTPKPEELSPRPGESVFEWMGRNTMWWLVQIEKIANDPNTPLKIKLEAYKELTTKTLPPRTSIELVRSPIDSLSEEELIARIKDKIQKYEEGKQLPLSNKNEKDPE